MIDENSVTLHTRRWRDWKGNKFTRKVTFVGVTRDNQLLIGKAECSNGPKRKPDVFNKSLGEEIALGRANKKPCLIIDLNDKSYSDMKLSDILAKACRNLGKTPKEKTAA